ncbi:MAG: tetratricopeptide repeat protein [Desulfobacteraceae bacterium]|nr:tetratricopeptide repeat protein [Desulfobacteraceae bacterium]
MKQTQFITAVLLVLAILLAGCSGASQYQRKEEAEAHRNIGEAYMRQGNYTAALKELLQAETMNPQDPHTYNVLGLCYLMKRQYRESALAFEKAVDLKPDFAPAINNLGTAYLALQEWDSAISAFQKITNDLLYATPHFPLSNLGMAYYNKREYATAKKYYSEALALQPDFVIALRGLGRTQMAMGETRSGIKTFEKALALDPGNAQLFMDAANAYRNAGDNANARVAYQRVIDLDPEAALATEAKHAISALP